VGAVLLEVLCQPIVVFVHLSVTFFRCVPSL
jgi:hypothetical protein